MPTLDASQRAFVEAPEGNIRLLAPAGCGKTLCLLHRCKHLSELQTEQQTRFLLVTFTRTAAHELNTRINDNPSFAILRGRADITTLNSWGWRRLRSISTNERLVTNNFARNETVSNHLQPIWRKHKSIAEAMKGRLRYAPRHILTAMDNLKALGFDHTHHTSFELFSNHLDNLHEHKLDWLLGEQIDRLIRFAVLPEALIEGHGLNSESAQRTLYNSFYRFWLAATALLGDSATFTLEDQKYFAFLDESSKVDEGSYLSGAARYNHILVDEFQDINPLDLNLIAAIAKRNRATITIVGDDDQAIFEWRGATPEYILTPETHFGADFNTLTLGVNYRSPRNIVAHSQMLIRHNERRVDKDIAPSSKTDASIEVNRVNGIDDAISKVEALIDDAAQSDSVIQTIGIIGSKRSHIIPYQVSFASNDLPFSAAEDLQLFLSDAFESILEVIGIKSRAGSRQGQSQIIADVLKLCDLVRRYPVSKSDKRFMRSHFQNMNVRSMEAAVHQLREYSGPLKGKNKGGKVSREMAEASEAFLSTETVSNALRTLDDHFDGLQIDFDKAEDDVFFTDPPFGQLADFANRYGGDYIQFLDDIERAKSQLVFFPSSEDGELDGHLASVLSRPVHLMTAPRSKGKEFDVVVVLGANDGNWPHKSSITQQQQEADRRLFYVAFTRAKRKVVILVDEQECARGAGPSPFIEELGLSV